MHDQAACFVCPSAEGTPSKTLQMSVYALIPHQCLSAWVATLNTLWTTINNHTWGDDISDEAEEIVDDAVEHGDDVPEAGTTVSVLCYADVYKRENEKTFCTQDTIIEVPNPIPEASTLLLFGSGLSGLLVIARKKGLIRL